MATKSQYSALLGYDPREDDLARRKLWAGLYGAAQSPWEKVGIGISQLGGALFDRVSGSEEQNPAAQLEKLTTEASSQFTPNSPEYYSYIASNTTNPTIKSNAAQLALESEAKRTESMQKEVKFYNENFATAPDRLQELAARVEANPNDKNALRQYNAVANAYQQGFYEDQRKSQEAPSTSADRGIYEDFVRQNGGDIVAAGKAFNQYKTDLRQKENTPLTEGNVKSGDISTFIGSVNTNLKPLDVKLRTYNEIRALIKQVADGNTVAVPQLERFMAKAAGDNQLSATEIRQLANSGGLVERTVGGVQKFVLGTPSNEKLKKTIELINSLEDQTSKEYNTSRDKLEATWGTSNLPKATLDAQLGGRYIPASQRDKANKETPSKPQKLVTKTTKSGVKYTVLEDAE